MEHKFKIKGGLPLSGKTAPGGSKNAALPLLAAAVLCSTPLTLRNVPDIEDVNNMLQILKSLGANVSEISSNTIRIDVCEGLRTALPEKLASRIRGSYYLIGSLLARYGEISTYFPGGCDVGERPMDLHISTLEQIGAEFEIMDQGNEIRAVVSNRTARGIHVIRLPFPSRGTTINLLLATSLLEGTRVRLENANTSPETTCLARFLSARGVVVHGVGTPTLEVVGRKEVEGGEYSVIPDKIEAGTLLCAGLITGGQVQLQGIVKDDMIPMLRKLAEIGYEVRHIDDSSLVVAQGEVLKPVDVISGLAATDMDADWEPLLAALLSTVPGISIVQDKMNPERHSRFIPELIKLGARIEQIDGQTARVFGNHKFVGAEVTAREIRGGAALVIAALAAEGVSTIRNVGQVDRGYEGFETKLRNLGARITRG